jgi:hypothetical protein
MNGTEDQPGESPLLAQTEDPHLIAREEENARQMQQMQEQRLEEDRRRVAELEARREAEEAARMQQAAQKREEENIRQLQQMLAQQLEEDRGRTTEIEARRQAEEAAWQQAAQQREEENIRQMQQMQAQRLQEDRRRAAEIEARRQAEEVARMQAAQKLEEEDARRIEQIQAKALEDSMRKAMPMETGKQEVPGSERTASGEEANRRAETAMRQAAAAGDRASPQQASSGTGTAEESSALQPRAQDAVPAQAHLHPSAPRQPAAVPDMPADSSQANASESGPILLSDEQLASFKVEQVRKVDLTRVDPQIAQELIDTSRGARRRTVFGSANDDRLLRMYIDDWRLAVERHGNLERRQLPNDAMRGDALVTVTIRSDGSIEAVSIDRSGGPLDEAVRHIVPLTDRYDPFPLELSRRYDVIEIRRLWSFGDTLRLLDAAR